MTPKCRRQWNRSVNEAESNVEHLGRFRSHFPNFSPYAIALHLRGRETAIARPVMVAGWCARSGIFRARRLIIAKLFFEVMVKGLNLVRVE